MEAVVGLTAEVLLIVVPVISLISVIVGFATRGRPPLWAVGLAALPLIGNLYFAVWFWTMVDRGMPDLTLFPLAFAVVALLALTIGTAAARRRRQFGPPLVLLGLLITLPLTFWLCVVLVIIAGGGMD